MNGAIESVLSSIIEEKRIPGNDLIENHFNGVCVGGSSEKKCDELGESIITKTVIVIGLY